jgi:hypothetical protein
MKNSCCTPDILPLQGFQQQGAPAPPDRRLKMTTHDYTMTFEAASEAIELYQLVRLPVKGQAYYAGYRYADNGRKVRLFARQHLGAGNRFTFSERLEDCAA